MRTHVHWTLSVFGIVLFVFALLCSAFAQSAPKNPPPSYIANPANFTLLAENDQFKVIPEKKPVGFRDAWHSHLPLAGYNLTDCHQRIYTPDGEVREATAKAGSVFLRPAEPSHSTENIGTAECDQILVERK